LTRECVLCGEFLLDQVSAAIVPDDQVQKLASLNGQNSYTIDLKTGEDKRKKLHK